MRFSMAMAGEKIGCIVFTMPLLFFIAIPLYCSVLFLAILMREPSQRERCGSFVTASYHPAFGSGSSCLRRSGSWYMNRTLTPHAPIFIYAEMVIPVWQAVEIRPCFQAAYIIASRTVGCGDEGTASLA